jgi:hypothetical protein
MPRVLQKESSLHYCGCKCAHLQRGCMRLARQRCCNTQSLRKPAAELSCGTIVQRSFIMTAWLHTMMHTCHYDVSAQAWIRGPIQRHPQHLQHNKKRNAKLAIGEAASRHAPAQRVAIHERPSRLVELARHKRQQHCVLCVRLLVRLPWQYAALLLGVHLEAAP